MELAFPLTSLSSLNLGAKLELVDQGLTAHTRGRAESGRRLGFLRLYLKFLDLSLSSPCPL